MDLSTTQQQALDAAIEAVELRLKKWGVPAPADGAPDYTQKMWTNLRGNVLATLRNYIATDSSRGLQTLAKAPSDFTWPAGNAMAEIAVIYQKHYTVSNKESAKPKFAPLLEGSSFTSMAALEEAMLAWMRCDGANAALKKLGLAQGYHR